MRRLGARGLAPIMLVLTLVIALAAATMVALTVRAFT